MPSARASGEGKDLNLKLVDRKSDNDGKRFIFRTFAQRVAAANIDVFHRLTADQADERELLGGDITDAPLAMSTMERWTELNCTGAFKAFNKELSPMLLSVPLMLHRRAELFSALNRHLAAAPSMALKPMLEVTSAIAADLRQEFYAEFPALLATLAALLSPSDVQLLEDVFSTLCYLFKYLLRQLLADLPAAFGAYRPLLAHERAHVRDFAAESFSFLLRRLTASKLPSAVAHAILPHVGAHGAALDQGIAQLFFYTVRGLGHAFHSRAPIVVKALILLLHPTFGSLAAASVSAPLARGAAAKALAREAAAKALAVREGGGGDEGPLMPVVVEALHLMSEHTRRAHASGVWIPLTEELKGAIEAWLRRLRRLAVAVEQAIFVDGDAKSSGRGLTKPDERGSGLTKPDEAAISDLSLLQFGISLLPWRHFEIRVLQPLLATCDALASTQPQSVLATLFALVHSDASAVASAGFTLKFGAPAGPCALALCLALETALAPITARGGGGTTLSATERQRQAWAESAHHGAHAHHGASAHHGARQAWAALKVLAATRSPQLGSLLPRILTAVRALLATPADALECSAEAEGGAHDDGALSPAGLLLHAAALEALTSLTASAEGAFTA
ncbi:small subunit processome component 20-like protein, partial [Chrysochromulina tobinii]